MKTRKELLDLLMLYDSDELSPSDRQQIEELLTEDPEAREHIASLREFHQRLQTRASLQPKDETLLFLRRNLIRRLRAAEPYTSFGERIKEIFSKRIALQFALGFASLVIGVIIGRNLLPGRELEMPQGEFPLTTIEKSPAMEQSALAPAFANVNMIRIDPLTNEIEVEFSAIHNRTVRGDINDPVIREVLAYALRKEQTGLRLKAVKAINTTEGSQAQSELDDKLVEALVQVVAGDPNDGVRLRAVEVLQKFQTNSKARDALIQTLLSDSSAAIRMKALESLAGQRLDETESSAFEAAASHDPNDYIRLQAKKLLIQTGAAVLR